MFYAFLIAKHFKHTVGNLKISDDRKTATYYEDYEVYETATFGAFIIVETGTLSPIAPQI